MPTGFNFEERNIWLLEEYCIATRGYGLEVVVSEAGVLQIRTWLVGFIELRFWACWISKWGQQSYKDVKALVPYLEWVQQVWKPLHCKG